MKYQKIYFFQYTMIVYAILIILALVAIYHYWRPRTIYDKLYFDNNSTTQPHAEVVNAVSEASYLGNASASYAFGAQVKVEGLKKKILEWTFPDPLKRSGYQVVITSGASEANNLIIRGLVDSASKSGDGSKPHLVLSSVEHKTSIDCAKQLQDLGRADVDFIEPDIYGVVDPATVMSHVRKNTVLVSVMHANNETGALNDVGSIAAMCQTGGIIFHTDAVQTFGKMRLGDLGAGAYSMSFHKMNGPVGVGALIIRSDIAKKMHSQIAGSQNDGLRGGTENIAGCAGGIRTMDITLYRRADKNARMLSMKKMFVNGLLQRFAVLPFSKFAHLTDDSALAMVKNMPTSESDITSKHKAVVFLGPVDTGGKPDYANSLPNTVLLAVVNLPGGETGVGDAYKRFCNVKLKSDLAARDVLISIGSACLTKLQGPSHVLKALAAPFIIRCGVVRVSFGDYNTEWQTRVLVDKFIETAWLQ